MINTKKYLALFLVLVLFLSHVPVHASARTDYPEVELPIIGNLNTINSMPTIYADNNLYASIMDLCKLVEADITDTTNDYVAIVFSHGGSCHNFFYRSNCVKAFIDGTEIYSVECPQLYYDNTVYISVLHFLEYLGIDSNIVVTQNVPTLLLYRQYSMFDALGEYISDNSSYWFDLEASGIIEDYEKAALLTLISSDPNLIKMLFDAEGIYREGIEDTMIEIIRNEGVATSRDNPYSFDSLETATDGLGLADQYLELLENSFKKDGIPIDGVTQKYIDKIGFAANLAPIATGYLHARLYDNMTAMQQSILSETIIGNQRYSTILTDETGSLVVDAAEKVHIRINDAYMNYSAEAIDKASDNLYEAIMGVNPVTAATDAIMQGYFVITETLIPGEYEYAEAVNHAFNCYMIQVAASEIFHGLFDEFCDNNFFVGNTDVQTQYLRQMKYALILQLKAAITLRDKLIDGNCLDEDGAFFAQLQNNQATDLLVRLESAEEVFPFELDLSNVAAVNMSTTPDSPSKPSNTTINQYGRFLLTEAPYADHTDLFQVYQYPIDGYIYVKKNSNSTSTSIITNVPGSIPLVEVETADYAHDGNPYRFTIETVLVDGVGGEHPTLCMKFFRNNVRYTNSDSSLSLYSDNESYFYIIDGPDNAYLVQESIEYKNIETAGILYQYKPSDYEAVITESIKITNLKTHDYYELSAVFDPSADSYKYDELSYSSGDGYDSRTLYYEAPENSGWSGELGTREGLVTYVQTTLEKYGLADRVFSDQSTLGEVKNVLCTQVIGDAKDYNLKTDTDLSITGTLWMGYPLGIDIPDAPIDTQSPATEGFAGNQTAEQLRKSIVGSWGAEGSVVSDYDFNSDGTCYWSFDKQTEGTYQIRDDKMLVITFPWMDDRYFWTEESYEEWRSHSSEDCWYMTDSGVLILNGVSYYRDGKVIKDYNTEGGLLETIAGAWVLDDFMEYRFFMDGTYEENMVSVSHGMLLSRVDIDAGQIEIIDDTHAKLWNEAESFGELSGYTELVYDPETDTLSVGGSNNVYHRAEYSD